MPSNLKLNRYNQLVKNSKTIEGRWKLTDKHELSYESIDDAIQKELDIKYSLVAIEAKTLVVGVTFTEEDKTVTQTLKIDGDWTLDPKNRIRFDIQKENSQKDTLTFQGTWEISKAREIVYSYEGYDLKKKSKQTRALTLRGFWDISEKNRLTYLVEGDSSQSLRFRGAFQTKSILAKKNEIRYQIGVEAKGKRQLKTISLFGKWKLSRDLALSFEIPYENNKKKAIIFGAEFSLTDKSTVEVNLRSQSGKPLGAELILTKEIFQDNGQLFVRLQRSLEESRIEAGARLRW